jgi:hypothetical protein
MRLLPIIIFVIIVINVLRRIAEFNRNRPKTEDDGTEWTAETGDPTLPPTLRPEKSARPTPSDRVREILEQLGQREPSPPPLTPVVPPPLPTPVPPPVPVARPAYSAPVARRYLAEETPEQPQAEVATAEASMPPLSRPPTSDAVYRESLRKAFPPALAIIRETRAQGRPPFTIRLRGRQSLRQAIVLAEVLGPPRAFDL